MKVPGGLPLYTWTPDLTETGGSRRLEGVSVRVSQDELDDLRLRLERTRWPFDADCDDWRYGVPGPVLRNVLEYWLDGYDWRAEEARINALPNYRTTIDGVSVHFVWIRSGEPDAVPIVLTHGWPWTFWDFHRLWAELCAGTDPSFDLVIPSLPGFAFSTISGPDPVGAQRTADIWQELMSRLGYSEYGAVGCDWGAYVSAHLAHAYASDSLGVYLTLGAIPGFDPARLSAHDYTGTESGWWERWRARSEKARAHVLYNKHYPLTQGWALADSPLGLAAMLIGHRKEWSDPNYDFIEVFGMDFLLTTVSLYWFTRTAGSAARFYADSLREPFRPSTVEPPLLKARIGVGTFPYEPVLVPRHVMATHANLAHWSVFDHGGHYAPLEATAVLANDIRQFYRGGRRLPR